MSTHLSGKFKRPAQAFFCDLALLRPCVVGADVAPQDKPLCQRIWPQVDSEQWLANLVWRVMESPGTGGCRLTLLEARRLKGPGEA